MNDIEFTSQSELLPEIEKLKTMILESPQNIEREFLKTNTQWLACFDTRTFLLSFNLHGMKNREIKISIVFEQKLNDLRKKASEIQEKYGGGRYQII